MGGLEDGEDGRMGDGRQKDGGWETEGRGREGWRGWDGDGRTGGWENVAWEDGGQNDGDGRTGVSGGWEGQVRVRGESDFLLETHSPIGPSVPLVSVQIC